MGEPIKSPDVGRPLWASGYEKVQKGLKVEQEFKDAGCYYEIGDKITLNDTEYEVVDYREMKFMKRTDDPMKKDVDTQIESTIVLRPVEGGAEVYFNIGEFKNKLKK
ncbi:hypothetical protein KKC88_05210 [Patescibacteria group bacterium]|nr:hypothetical protein [Patescibacteria group bacterium]MBU1673725.1 hypothetical protein [Patescibacteria group bacterium]MBU1963045.1 hypothetical protein [Patescibacteria group bacterium]